MTIHRAYKLYRGKVQSPHLLIQRHFQLTKQCHDEEKSFGDLSSHPNKIGGKPRDEHHRRTLTARTRPKHTPSKKDEWYSDDEESDNDDDSGSVDSGADDDNNPWHSSAWERQNGRLIRESIDSQGTVTRRAMDNQSNVLLAQFNQQGDMLGQSMFNMNALLKQMDQLGYTGMGRQPGDLAPQQLANRRAAIDSGLMQRQDPYFKTFG